MITMVFDMKKCKYPILVAIFTLIFFWKVLLFPSHALYSPSSDLNTQHFFWMSLLHDAFQGFGELPLWNPYTFSGKPFLADHFSKMFYPLNVPFLLISPESYYSIFYIIHFFLGAIFLYLFARQIGLSDFSSFIAALVYQFSARTAATLVYAGLPLELPLFAFLPAALYLFELFVKNPKPKYLVLISVCISLIILGTHTQFTIYGILFLAIYIFSRSIAVYRSGSKKQAMKLFFSISGAMIMGILISSIQLLPSLEILEYDTRSSDLSYEYATGSSFPPFHILTMLIPNFFGNLAHGDYWSLFPYWQFVIYIGIFPLILSLLALRKKNYYIIFFGLALLVSFLLALGKYNPLYPLFYKFVPLFGKFRAPSRFLFFYTLSISMLAGFGMNHLFALKKKDKKFLYKAAILLLSLSLLSLVAFAGIEAYKKDILELGKALLESKYSKSDLELEPIGYYNGKIGRSFADIITGILIFAALLLASSLVILLWVKDKISRRTLAIFVFLLVFFDIWIFSMPHVELRPLDIIYPQKSVPAFLSIDNGNFRYLDLSNALPQQAAVKYRLEQITGYEPMVLGYYRQYASAMAGIPFIPSTTIPIKDIRYPKLLDLLNAKYIITNKKMENKDYELVFNSTSFAYLNNGREFYFDEKIDDGLFEFSRTKANYVYRNNDYLPRAFVVGDYIVQEKGRALDAMKKEDFDPKRYVILEEDPEKAKNFMYREAGIKLYSPNRIVVNVDLDKPGFLVLSEVWYPGWKALDNGKESKIYRANYIFRSVYLEAGKHDIEFKFEPLTYRVGLWVSSISVLAILSYFIFRIFR